MIESNGSEKDKSQHPLVNTTLQKICPKCDNKLRYISKVENWYCDGCKDYTLPRSHMEWVKKQYPDKKLVITIMIIIILILTIIFSFSYLQQQDDSEIKYHYEIPILDENGKEVGGVHMGSGGIPIENISITLVNITSSVSSYHELSEGVFICKNTRLKLTYEDKNKDDLFNQGDFMYVYGQTPGSVVKIIHITGRSIAEIIFQ